jgi:hypothetical protein
MLNKTKIALVAAALVLGAATAAQAGTKDDADGSGGGPNQTWQDIELARQSIQAQLQREYHTGSGAFASDVKKKHVSH